jgi:hypothetical protein
MSLFVYGLILVQIFIHLYKYFVGDTNISVRRLHLLILVPPPTHIKPTFHTH